MRQLQNGSQRAAQIHILKVLQVTCLAPLKLPIGNHGSSSTSTMSTDFILQLMYSYHLSTLIRGGDVV